MDHDAVAEAMRRLCAAERGRHEAIVDLIRLGAVRSMRNPAAELAEAVAARFYGVELAANANHPGYDLETADGRLVQVRGLRAHSDGGKRTIMGAMKEPYDTLFAVRFSVDYEPLRAIEVPRGVLEAHYPHGVRTLGPSA